MQFKFLKTKWIEMGMQEEWQKEMSFAGVECLGEA